MEEKEFLDALERKRMTLADATLQDPERFEAFGAAFAYGHTVGVNHGLRLAKELLLMMLEDEKEKDL